MDTPTSNILLICMLATIPIAAVVVFVTVALVRNRRSTLRRDSGVPIGFGLDASQANSDPSVTVELQHHHHHHHSAGDPGHHHSHSGFDAGASHHSGGSDGGASSSGHH